MTFIGGAAFLTEFFGPRCIRMAISPDAFSFYESKIFLGTKTLYLQVTFVVIHKVGNANIFSKAQMVGLLMQWESPFITQCH